MKAEPVSQFHPRLGQGGRDTGRQLTGPEGPRLGTITFAQRHEQDIVVKPGHGGAELGKFRVRRRRKQPPRLFQQGGPEGSRTGVVELILGKNRPVCELPGGKQTLVGQLGQVDKQGVAGEGGKGHIGRVGEKLATRPQGQDLPVALAGRRQKIHETFGPAPQVAGAERPRQGGNMQKNPGTPWQIHRTSLKSRKNLQISPDYSR